MRDLFGLLLSVGLPWIAGALWVSALHRKSESKSWLLNAGYGYPIGAFATTLVMRLVDAAGVAWSLALVALPVLALAAIGFFPGRSTSPLSEQWSRCRHAFNALPASLRALFWLCLALTGIRVAGLALEIAWRPLQPWDAWAQWATKARVWYHYGHMAPFVYPAEWLAAGDSMHFMDVHSEYPATIPLLQVWTALGIGHWDESLINAPWVAIVIALGLAFYAQARRLGQSAPVAMLFIYLLLSLPFLDIHVALAGCADIFIAAAYGMAAMALWQWTLTRERADAVLAAVMAITCIAIKVEGLFWALTLVPPVIVAIDRRLGLGAAALLGATALLYLLFGPQQLLIFGYALGTSFTNVSQPLYQHLFVMDNWHLLWYATIAVIVLCHRILFSAKIAPMSVTMLGAVGFVFVVFFFSSAAGGVDDESLVNRLPLHLVPALVFYLVLAWRERERSVAANVGASPAGVQRIGA